MLEKRQSFTFVWGFTAGDAISLKSCTAAAVFVSRDAQNGSSQASVAPYTIIAYPDQGVPTVDLLGSNIDAMSWTPRFPAGTKVLINVVDALGNSGGVAQQLYTLGSSTTTSCIPSTPNSGFKASIDGVSGSLQTCSILPIHIEGGAKPYTITIAATNAATAVNTTLDSNNDYYQWINRADPNQSLVAAISDSTGQYAAVTQFFTTAGPTDISCGGQTNIQSVYGSSSQSDGQPSSSTTSRSSSTTSPAAEEPAKGANKSLTGAIIGTILGLLVVLGVIAYIFFKKRNARAKYSGDSSSGGGGGGFGMKDYKRGGNLPGNESFLPLHDNETLPRTPVIGDQSAYAPRRQSNLEYYSSPPSNFSGTHESMGTSGSGSGPSVSSPPSTNVHLSAAAIAARPQTKREMMAADQLRQQQWNGAQQQIRPESMYPAASSYTVNPFGDNAYPYNPAGGATQQMHSHAPSSSFGSRPAYGTGAPTGTIPSSYNPSHVGTGNAPRASGSQDLTTMSAATGPKPAVVMTPAARAKAAEAAQRPAYADEDDDDLLAYTQPRLMLGVTNPDRASVATTNTTASADPYGGTAAHASPAGSARLGANTPTQVYQHEDAGAVVELPPAYREFTKTPGPGGGPPRL